MSNVLITGANSGFGLLAVRTFAEAGHTVYAGFRSERRAAELQSLSRALPLVRPVRLDVTDQNLIDGAVEEARRAGPIDVLINNAGFEVSCPVDSLSDDLLHRQFDTNVFGVVRMIRAVAPHMRERKRGVIINLSSIVGWLTVPYGAAYAATKHAVESLSEGLWFELAPFGIRVAVIEPGVFPTQFHSNIEWAADFDAGSPHWANAERYRGGMRPAMNGAKSDPQEVADLMFEAATTATPRFRYVAGVDARAFIPAYKSMEFEAFSEALLTRAGLGDWAAPT